MTMMSMDAVFEIGLTLTLTTTFSLSKDFSGLPRFFPEQFEQPELVSLSGSKLVPTGLALHVLLFLLEPEPPTVGALHLLVVAPAHLDRGVPSTS